MNADFNYDVILVTFLRPHKLKRCLNALSKLPLPPNRVIIADQTNLLIGDSMSSNELKLFFSREKVKEIERLIQVYNDVYTLFKKYLNIKVVKVEFDAGLTKSRKKALEHSTAKYIFVLDDDIYLPRDALQVYEILKESHEIGGVALLLKDRNKIVCKAGDILYSKKHVSIIADRNKPIYRTSSGIRFMLFDYIPNCALFRRECLEDYKWDEFFKIGYEHADFYLTHKRLGKWKFAVSLDHIAIHDHQTGESILYLSFRNRPEIFIMNYEYLLKKHNIKSFVVEDVYLTEHTGLKDQILKLIMFKLLPRPFYCSLYKRILLPRRVKKMIAKAIIK